MKRQLNSKCEIGKLSAIGVVLTLGVSHQSFAGFINGPVWIVDSPSDAVVFFSSTAVLIDEVHNLGSFTSPNNFWTISSLNIVEIDSGPLDMVSISGQFTHLTTPTVGPPLTFSFSFDATTPGITAGVILSSDLQIHGAGFFDALAVQVQANVSNTEITGYGIGMGAGHFIPLPAGVWMGSLGILAVILFRQKIFHVI